MSTLPSELEARRAYDDIALRAARGERRIQIAAKRALDILVSGVLLILLAVPMLLIAIAVKLDSRGPAVIKQQRVKRDGTTTFAFHKFRTMRSDAEALKAAIAHHNEHDGPIFKMREDPRRTRLGKFLRKSSLDELPNLWDVLVGNMSLVGPRPAFPHEVAQYSEREMARLSAKPGMTGLWQVEGRSLLGWDEMVRHDIDYVTDWSFWLDVRILLRTLPAVISGRGAF